MRRIGVECRVVADEECVILVEVKRQFVRVQAVHVYSLSPAPIHVRFACTLRA